MKKDMTTAELAQLCSLRAWKAEPEEGAKLEKEGFAGGVLKDSDAVVRFIREEGGSEEDVELAVKEMSDADGKGAMISATISSGSVDRQNDTIAVKGWDLKSFKKNPVILLNHASRSLPVAIATSTFKSKKDDTLKQTILFNDKDLDPAGWQVGQFYAAQKMRAFSVGFRPLDFAVNEARSGDGYWDIAIDFLKQELLENSAVTIPANSDALADAKSMGTLPGFLKMAVEAIEKSGGWAFAPDEVKAAYAACADLEDKRVFIDLGAGKKEFAPMPAPAEKSGPEQEENASSAEGDTNTDEESDGGDPVQEDEFEIDAEDAEIIGTTVAQLVETQLSALEEELSKSHTAATGRLD